jgi:hypothetical protein
MKARKRFLKINAAPILALLCMLIMAVSLNKEYSARHISDYTGGQDNEHRSRAETGGKSDLAEKALSDKEEERSYRRDNVVITVKKLYAEGRYFWNFEVTIENLNEIKKTVEGKICLYNMYIQPRECGSEECTVTVAVQPKSVRSSKFRCKGKMDMNSWAFLILEIHNY